jgi:hypothetical protein
MLRCLGLFFFLMAAGGLFSGEAFAKIAVTRIKEGAGIRIDTDLLRAEIDLQKGGCISSLINKKNQHQLTWYDGKSGGLLVGSHDGSATVPFTSKEVRGSGYIDLILTSDPYPHIGRGSKVTGTEPTEFRVIKKIRFQERIPRIDVEYTIQNVGQNDIPGMSIWFWNSAKPGGKERVPSTLSRFFPSISGTKNMPTSGWAYRKDIAAPWHAVIESETKEAVAFITEAESLHAFYYWTRSDFYPSIEWMTPVINFSAGREITTHFSLCVVNGLEKIDWMTEKYAIATTLDDASRYTLALVSLEDRPALFRCEARFEDEKGNIVHQSLRTLEVRKPGEVVSSTISLAPFIKGGEKLKVVEKISSKDIPVSVVSLPLHKDLLIAPLSGTPVVKSSSVKGWTRAIKAKENYAVPTAEEKEQGLLFFQKGVMKDITSETLPREKDRIQRVEVKMAKNEMELCELSCYALRSGPLQLSVDMPSIRCEIFREDERMMYVGSYNLGATPHLVSELLSPSSSATLIQNKSRRFWIMAETDASTRSGIHEGKIRVAFEGKEVLVPFTIEVVPVLLCSDPERKFGVFVRNGLHDPPMRASILADIKKHGRDVLVATPQLDLEYDADNDIFIINFARMDDYVAALQKAGMEGPIIFGLHGEIFNVIQKVTGEKLLGPKSLAYYRNIVIEVERHATLNGYPRLLWHPLDEQASYEPMATILRTIKEANPTALTIHTVAGIEAAKRWGKDLDVWFPSSMAFDPEVQDYCQKEKKLLFSYSGQERISGGYGFYYNPAISVICPWTYNHNDWKPFSAIQDKKPSCFVYPNETYDGVISTLDWERLREGYDDFRMLYTLEKLCEGKKGASAERGRAYLKELKKELDTKKITHITVSSLRENLLQLLSECASER